ncbi:MAG TPA: 5'-3' exonuclease H3TH domain-containing protein [Patescibacteria group bacterium]|nr:5'-3' exonuclease H3TH domain-containing protein [Patescibacteria group bacterium]
MQTKLILIDGNAILHRAFHALPSNLKSKRGEPVNAVYGFVAILINLVTAQNPTHIAVCFDTPVETLRKAQYVGYQATRPRLQSDLSSQFELTYKVLKAMNIPIYKKERYEADDCIGTIVHQCVGLVDEVVIVTGDRDILQLVNDKNKVQVYMPVQGINKAKLYNEKEVFDRMGVKASQIIDYKGLAGDSSDNYPGVPGIGPGTATKLLRQYKTLEDIYKDISNIPEKISKKLALGAESAVMSKNLATIMVDVPITFNLEDSGKWSLNSQKVLDEFAEIGFKTLTARVKQLPLI